MKDLLDLFRATPSATSAELPDLSELPIGGNEVAEIGQERSDSGVKEDLTILKEVLSGISAFGSIFALGLTGKKLPIYQGTKADKILNKVSNWVSNKINSSKVLSAANSIKNQFFKEAINIAAAGLNIGLFCFNGGSVPLFKGTVSEGVASKAAGFAKKSWNTFEKIPYLGAGFRGAAYLNQAKNNFVRSGFVYNTLVCAAGLVALGTGPIGVSLVTASVAIRIADDASKINRVQVLEDELCHLQSLKNSMEKIERLGTPERVTALGMSVPEFKKEANHQAKKYGDGLNVATKKSSIVISSHQILPVASAATSTLNPASLAFMGIQASVVVVTSVSGRLSEGGAKRNIESEIEKLRGELQLDYNTKASRKYDLAKTAYEYAIYAASLEAGTDKTNEMKRDLSFSKLFNEHKITEKKGLPYVLGAMKTGFWNTCDSLHPWKEPTSYVKTHEKMEKEKKNIAAAPATLNQPLSSPALPSPNTPYVGKSRARGCVRITV